MKTRTFVEELQEAGLHHYAVGAFNIFNYLSAGAVIQAASSLNCPVILQTSSSTVKRFGPVGLSAMLKQLMLDAPVNVLLHLDHCRDLPQAKACVDAGWDSVMYDGSALPVEENIAHCREIADYAHPRGVYVEGELGRICGVEEEIQVAEGEESATDLDGAVDFVRRSGIDAFAPAIGTAHGVYKGTPRIRFDFVSALKGAIDVPIVIHGGTGLSEETFLRLIDCGGAKINVSTALKHGYVDGAREYLAKNMDAYNPLAFDQYLSDSVQKVAAYHMTIFRGAAR